MRIIAFILMFVLGIANFVCNIVARTRLFRINKIQTLIRRLPPTVASGGLFNPKQFKSPAYSVYCASGFVAWLGLYTGQ